jgi:RNA polymerase sigma-70 factor (ECF subfamily)
MDPTPDFDAVLDAARHGEEWAFGSLYRQYRPLVDGYLRARLGAVDEDIAAEVWVGVAKGLRTFAGQESRFRFWLVTIASRRIADRQRAWNRDRTDVVDPERLSDIPGRDDPASSVLDGIAADDVVSRLVRNLTPDQAEVVLLRVLGGFEVSEVAELLERSDNWVRVTQHRAVRRMAERLTPKAATA